jgi:hypothetical protein
MAAKLEKLTIERQQDGRYRMVREIASSSGDVTGDTWFCKDLVEAFEIVNAGFLPDGSVRSAAR